MKHRVLRDELVGQIFGVHRGTVWRWARTIHDFPRPVKFAPGLTGWLQADIDEYIAKRAADSRAAVK